MARIACFADTESERLALLAAALTIVDPSLRVVEARIDVARLAKLSPSFLVVDLDALLVDRLETLRQLRFVLPVCIVAVYTEEITHAWSFACHLAGANGVLSKLSEEGELASGILGTLRDGCYTNPRFAAG